jgi:putative ATP-binding cassette transporter
MSLFGSIYKLLSFLVRYTRHVRGAHLMGAGVIAAAVLSGVANTALVAMVNQVISVDRPGVSLLVVFLGICVAFPLLRFVGDMLLATLTARASVHLRMTMAARMLAVPLRRLEELGTSKLNVTLLDDFPTVVNAMVLIPMLTLNLTVVAGCLIYMGALSWKMLLGVLFFLVVGVVAYQLPMAAAQLHVRKLRDTADDLFGHLRALTDGVKELKLHRDRRRAFLDEELRATAVQVQVHSVASQRAFSSAISFGQVLIFLLIAGVVFALPLVTQVERTVLTGYTFAILYMVGPVQVLLNSTSQLTRAITAMDRLEATGLQLAEAARNPGPELPAALPAATGWSSLEFDGVTHVYHSERDGDFTLGPVNLAFHPGELVFITGGNGSGKTTLAKLLTGLYTPEGGWCGWTAGWWARPSWSTSTRSSRRSSPTSSSSPRSWGWGARSWTTTRSTTWSSCRSTTR